MSLLTEDQLIIRGMIREFARDRLRPVASEPEERDVYPLGDLQAMAALGLTGMTVPAEYGGCAGDFVSLAIVIEEIARVSASHAALLGAHICLCQQAILAWGSEEQKRRCLPGLARGERFGTLCLESFATDSRNQGAVVAIAEKDGYLLNGQNALVINGGEADILIAFATLQGRQSAFIVEKNFPGFESGRVSDIPGFHAAAVMDIRFHDCYVPATNLLGEEGDGQAIRKTAHQAGMIGMAALATGIAQGALEAIMNCSRETELDYTGPGLDWTVAGMAVKVEAARLLTRQAALYKDNGIPFGPEAAMARISASGAATHITTRAVGILGAMGCGPDYPAGVFLRDAAMTEIYGSPGALAREALADGLTGRSA